MLEQRAPHRAGPLPALRVAVLRLDGEDVEPARPAEPELAVDAPGPAVLVEERAVGDHRADVRLGVEVVARPPDQHAGALVVAPLPRLDPPAGHLVVGEHHAERRPAHLAGQLRSEVRIHERARVHEVDR